MRYSVGVCGWRRGWMYLRLGRPASPEPWPLHAPRSWHCGRWTPGWWLGYSVGQSSGQCGSEHCFLN
jgi:hypothetical protein